MLIVGCGTSGVQLGLELAASGRDVTVAGTPTAHIPAALVNLAGGLWFGFLHHILTQGTPIGRKAIPQILGSGAPLIGIGPRDLAQAGVHRVPRFSAVIDGLPRLSNGEVIETDAVLWATGFRTDFSWIENLSVDAHGLPEHNRGLSSTIPGLAFLGLPFQYGLTSTLIAGAGRDAAYVAHALTTTASAGTQ